MAGVAVSRACQKLQVQRQFTWMGLLWLRPDVRNDIFSESNENHVKMQFECDFSPFKFSNINPVPFMC